jgi:pullulanase
MNKYIRLCCVAVLNFFSCHLRQEVPATFESYPAYSGDDLGLSYTPETLQFKIWAPTAKKVFLHLFTQGEVTKPRETLEMQKTKDGVWKVTVNGDLQGLFYTYQVETDKGLLAETPGIYAKAVGVNGQRAAIVDLSKTNPEGWDHDIRPELIQPNDIILYEVHVRDFTVAPNAGSSNPGKYIGMVEAGTKNAHGQSTGIDHLRELGITHVHLLPVFDHRSIDEKKLETPQFNWGYDPKNYNVPEGSFSTNPFDPAIRITEFKKMVMGFHASGMRVIMDVVYNHTGETENSNFNLEVPGYYYRHNADSSFSNASACGNETASERAMMRKYIIESCKYWVTEYHIDGFRFDLMGIHDIETMNLLTRELRRIDPTLFFYGEGWTAGASPLPDSLRALKANTAALENVAAFSDDLRDGIKGSVFEDQGKGFVNGADGAEESIKFGIVGATRHPQVNYEKVNYSKSPWSPRPSQCINYVSCHDNHTLYDKLVMTCGSNCSKAEIERMDKMAQAIVFTSQGVPFLHAGEEMLRTKGGEHNSFNKPDSINRINWDWKWQHADVVKYYRGLIALRKAHPAFRMTSTEAIISNLKFLETEPHAIAYTLNGKAAGDSWSEILVIFNANRKEIELQLPSGQWRLAVDGDQVDLQNGKIINSGNQRIPALNAWVLYKN